MRSLFANAIYLLLFLVPSLYAKPPELIGIIRSDTANTLFGYEIVPLGDQNGDGYDDIMIWDYRFTEYLYHGGSIVDTVPFLRIDSVNARMNHIGDINGDGYDDIVIEGRSPFNWKLNLYYGGPAMDTIRDMWFGLDTLFGLGYTVHTADINNNGYDELISWSNKQSSVLLFELAEDKDSIPDAVITPANLPYDGYSFGEGLAAGDFNGDGFPDLAVSLIRIPQQFTNGSVYLYWGGPSFDTIPDLVLRRPGEYQDGREYFGVRLENLGDVNGDGFDDIYVASHATQDTVSFIYFGGPDIDTIPDVTIYERHDRARRAGDLNGDGYNDLIISLPTPSSWGTVNIYLGSPAMSGKPDLTINGLDFEDYYWWFGIECSGIGDYNGDGVNDFAFAAINAWNHGLVFIYSGWTKPIDVQPEESILPETFILKQNYPNPFNSSTTIEFAIRIRGMVRLSVYNNMGQSVCELINGVLSKGNYGVTWDGRDSAGKEVSTGVYFYKLQEGGLQDSKKMIFLK
jgi:hypothetical protein